MSRDKSVWFAEEILLDAKLINFQLETGEWDAVEEMLKAEAQLSRDAETGRLRPKKASEYTLRFIAEVLHIMRLDIEQSSYNLATLGVAEQCLRLIRSCAASGTKMQTYITKDLSILDAMLVISSEFQQPSGELVSEEVLKKFENCMIVLIQTLGNLVVNNPFNQIIIWDKFESVILNCLIGQNDKIASAAAMIIYNILLSQPNVLPDDVVLLNSLSFMYHNGNTEYPHLIIEYLIGVENAYIEKLYSKLEPECRLLVLNLAHNILSSLESQDINVSVNFVRFMALEFKIKSDLILKTVDKYVNSIEPQEVVFLLDILATASSMEAYMESLQNDTSLFINCSFLLQAIHKLGKESNNFFSSLNKLYANTGKKLVPDLIQEQPKHMDQIPLAKNDSADNMLSCNETISECTESESSEQYFECNELPSMLEKAEPINTVEELQQTLKFIEATIPDTKPPKAPVKTHSDPPKPKVDTNITTVGFIQENVSFNSKENIEVSRGSSIGHELSKPINIFETKGSQSLPPSRKISLEHKIDMEDIEPPLILDSNSPSGSIKTITEVIPVALSTKSDFKSDSANASQPASNDSPTDPATEMTVTNYAKTEVKPSASQVSPPLSDNSQENDLGKKPSPDQPKEPKRSQNLSTDFDLSEQLQRILGTGREDKKPDHKEVKIVEEPTTMPTVKISSPDGQKNRLGAIDMSRPKVKQTLVHSVEQHVAFGFKGTLVRVIANLCWKHQINKKQIRDLGMIPILLDCCNIDERNPLIMQWVIFAIRNICENCPENQEVIAKTTLQRPINNDLLQEMGLTLHADPQNNTITVMPLKVQ